MTGERLQEIADRLEIVEVLSTWHQALDAREWDVLRDEVFAQDIDWAFEGTDGARTYRDGARGADVIPWLDAAVTGATIKHFNGNHVVTLDGDRARTRGSMHALDLTTFVTVGAGVVTAEHVRTSAGWRIARLHVLEYVLPVAIDWMNQNPVGGKREGTFQAGDRESDA